MGAGNQLLANQRETKSMRRMRAIPASGESTSGVNFFSKGVLFDVSSSLT
jgi:hypothetical protein